MFDWLLRQFARLFPRITQYRITPQVLATMSELALQTHPKEVIGLLQGVHEGDTLVVNKIIFQPFKNTATSATIHWDSALTGIVGTFHSHPGGDPRPSRQDKRLFAQHAGVHVIVPEPYEAAAVYDTRGQLLGMHALRVGRVRSQIRLRAR